jgi:predicted methyltransferase
LYRTLPVAAALAALLYTVTAPAQPAGVPASIAAAIAAPDRPKADTDRDALRHPAQLIGFAGVKSGDHVGDLMPGKGYFTRIFSNVVGPTGHVYAIVPAELAQVAPKIPEAMKVLAAEPAFANVTSLVVPAAAVGAPVKLDVAWTSDNYHDLYGYFGAGQAAAFDRAVFESLKPGGVFIVVDHVASPGSSETSPKTLHRIDPETVKAQVLAAGFVFEAESAVLRNPADMHDLKVFAPQIRGRTDQFVFRFRRPVK